MKKKADGVPSMIIFFISILFTITIFVGLMYTKADDYSSKSMVDKKDYDELVLSNLAFKEISAQSGLNRRLDNFTAVIALADNSKQINLSSLTVLFSSNRGQAVLSYRQSSVPEVLNNSGYNTWNMEEAGLVSNVYPTYLSEDYDDDMINDSVIILNSSYIQFNISSIGQFNYSLGNVDLSGSSGDPQTIDVQTTQIERNGVVYGSFLISGISDIDMTIPRGVNFSIFPKQLGRGYYTAGYVGKGKDYRQGLLSPDDALRIYLESPGGIFYGDDFEIKLFLEKGLTSSVSFHVTEPFKQDQIFFPVN